MFNALETPTPPPAIAKCGTKHPDLCLLNQELPVPAYTDDLDPAYAEM